MDLKQTHKKVFLKSLDESFNAFKKALNQEIKVKRLKEGIDGEGLARLSERKSDLDYYRELMWDASGRLIKLDSK